MGKTDFSNPVKYNEKEKNSIKNKLKYLHITEWFCTLIPAVSVIAAAIALIHRISQTGFDRVSIIGLVILCLASIIPVVTFVKLVKNNEADNKLIHEMIRDLAQRNIPCWRSPDSNEIFDVMFTSTDKHGAKTGFLFKPRTADMYYVIHKNGCHMVTKNDANNIWKKGNKAFQSTINYFESNCKGE